MPGDASGGDTGSTADSSAPADTSSPVDSGLQEDSAPADSGQTTDTGSPIDSGSPVDSGAPADSGLVDTGTLEDSARPEDSSRPEDSGQVEDSGSLDTGSADTGAADSMVPLDGAMDGATDGGDAAACPSTPPVGMCSSNGEVCSYPSEVCRCSYGAPVMVNLTWHCSVLSPGCPEPEPEAGTPCSPPGLTCNYGACQGGDELVCTNGSWTLGMMICPP
jgi:hypothetical protein